MSNVQSERVWRDAHPKVKQRIIDAQDEMSTVSGRHYDRNGEDITHLVEVSMKKPSRGDFARKQEATDTLSKHQVDHGGFVFAFYEQSRMINERFPSLSKPDFARLMYVGSYTAWESGKVVYDNGKAVDKDGLHLLLGLSRKRYNELYNRFIDEGILRVEDGELYVNPTVFYRGGKAGFTGIARDMSHTRLFRKTIRDLYKGSEGRRLSHLAVVYTVLPFINFRTNIVAYNPETRVPTEVQPMPLSGLAVYLGYSNDRALKQALNTVRIFDEPVFGFFENPHDRRGFRIIVNPRVIFASTADDLVAVMALFN